MHLIILTVIVVLIVVFVLWIGNIRFEQGFRKDVAENIGRTKTLPTEMLTEADLQSLPFPVQKYLRYSGALHKPKVRSMHIVFDGTMRAKDKDWFPFRSEQYNFFDEPARLFFMKAKMFGVSVPGYHRYISATATMDIRLFGLFPVVQKSGDIMNKTETVTLFNDMCLLAPASLIDKRIHWQEIEGNTVGAFFDNHGISIHATLFFNTEGQLIDFRSEDRTEISDMKQYPFTTPVSEYRSISGSNTMTYGEAIWHYPDGPFTYGKFNLNKIEYNCH
jgi:hypothetical protein